MLDSLLSTLVGSISTYLFIRDQERRNLKSQRKNMVKKLLFYVDTVRANITAIRQLKLENPKEKEIDLSQVSLCIFPNKEFFLDFSEISLLCSGDWDFINNLSVIANLVKNYDKNLDSFEKIKKNSLKNLTDGNERSQANDYFELQKNICNKNLKNCMNELHAHTKVFIDKRYEMLKGLLSRKDLKKISNQILKPQEET